jgi:hypothetical protein
MNAHALAETQDHQVVSRQISDGPATETALPGRGDGHLVLVVGDKFRAFSDGKAAITLSQLRGLLDLPAGLILCERTILVPGQGLSDGDVAEILQRAETTAHRERIDFRLWTMVPKRVEGKLSHKHRERNILVSAPRRIDEDDYELDLLIDENCELMDDHQTGQHLQGMVLVEAARQAFLAVTEAFILPRDGGKVYFVFNSLAIEFKRFMFPIASGIKLRVLERGHGGKYPRFAVDILFEQAGQETAHVRAGYMIMPDQRILQVEQGLAEQAIAWQFDNLATLAPAMLPDTLVAE